MGKKTKDLGQLLDLLMTANTKENLLLNGIAVVGHNPKRSPVWVKILLEERSRSEKLWKEFEKECIKAHSTAKDGIHKTK